MSYRPARLLVNVPRARRYICWRSRLLLWSISPYYCALGKHNLVVHPAAMIYLLRYGLLVVRSHFLQHHGYQRRGDA